MDRALQAEATLAAGRHQEEERRTLLLRVEKMRAAKNWSEREMSRRAQLSRGSWRRLQAATCDLAIWLPALRSAVQRLGA